MNILRDDLIHLLKNQHSGMPCIFFYKEKTKTFLIYTFFFNTVYKHLYIFTSFFKIVKNKQDTSTKIKTLNAFNYIFKINDDATHVAPCKSIIACWRFRNQTLLQQNEQAHFVFTLCTKKVSCLNDKKKKDDAYTN